MYIINHNPLLDPILKVGKLLNEYIHVFFFFFLQLQMLFITLANILLLAKLARKPKFFECEIENTKTGNHMRRLACFKTTILIRTICLLCKFLQQLFIDTMAL